MDVQMPEMGGFEATQAIRDARNGGRAARADRRADGARDAGRSRALPRGGHGRLSAQADRRRTNSLPQSNGIAGQTSRPRSQAGRRRASSDAIFDEKAALAHTGGDRRLLKEIIAMFRADYPALCRRIRRAIHAARRRGASAGGACAEGLDRHRRIARRPARGARARTHGSRERVRRHAEAAYTNLSPDSSRMLERAFAAAKLVSQAAEATPIMNRILVVDDDRVTRHVLRKVLTAAGFSTTVGQGWRRGAQGASQPALRSCCCSMSGCRG